MADFSWISQEDALSSAALTVRAQTVDPTDDGRLLWDVFFPREDVDSIKLSEITTLDFRPVGDRREWNARGRKIHVPIPPLKEIEMVPIESTFSIDEYEQQLLAERTLGNEDLFRQIIGLELPTRTDSLVSANFRRIELDVFEAWSLGQITAMNPETGTTQVVDFGFDAARYPTAGTDWATAGNAYNEFISFLRTARETIGSVGAAIMRTATLLEILADTPNPISPNFQDIEPTLAQLESRVSDVLGARFTIFEVELTQDPYADAGITQAAAKIWPAQLVGAIPAGGQIGSVKFAPVVRAMELARQTPEAGIDIRGQTVYTEITGMGRHLTLEAQVNAMPVPNEQWVYVIDAGV